MDEIDTSGLALATREATELEQAMERLKTLGPQVGRSVTGAFQDIALKGKGLGDVFRSLALSLSKLVLKAALKPLEQGIGNLFSGLFSGVTGFAKGGVFNQSMPVPFAKGGVISSPVAFPLGNGGTGIAGEAGPEAIIPLARGPDGRLGVRSRGGSGGVNVTFNVQATDAASFMRSESQVAAMLARAVGQGQRNL